MNNNEDKYLLDMNPIKYNDDNDDIYSDYSQVQQHINSLINFNNVDEIIAIEKQQDLKKLEKDLIDIQEIQDTFLELGIDQGGNLELINDKLDEVDFVIEKGEKEIKEAYNITKSYRGKILGTALGTIVGGVAGGGIGSAIGFYASMVGTGVGIGSGFIVGLGSSYALK